MSVNMADAGPDEQCPGWLIEKAVGVCVVPLRLIFWIRGQVPDRFWDLIQAGLIQFLQPGDDRLVDISRIGQHIRTLDRVGDFISFFNRDASADPELFQTLPMVPSLSMRHFWYSPDPGLNEVVLCAGEVPGGIPRQVLTWHETGSPFLLIQVPNNILIYRMNIGKLLLEK